ncbi:hypothetical protein BU24DRAFT_420678 [Aaosphaeria arxii CBS 175.79]|uniref:Ribosome biogenesis protein SLX9 n=1 Tax=Aaosphaeria arxii CBS 175.79 TaxID=1450172 RepID=A0A6A5XZD2_9PLEO|nr:uncharacterized protein BU24DRAFT_420678 [Aaosphaeria arxii CBS 175.79]KAF2017634.1 hypothetical protein BU24DRAFT_420678 [Aaosphaeria arxii CBS 175.79]
MAPTVTKKRTTARAKVARVPKPTTTSAATSASAAGSGVFASKTDRRAHKHSSFVSKIEKNSSKTLKRRRPNKKLVATLESLADALPGLEDGEGDRDNDSGDMVIGQAKIQKRRNLKSLKSRPGAMKRKEKLERMERERFNANLAQMAGKNENTTSIADRWAALKSHVQSTVETKAEFAEKKG